METWETVTQGAEQSQALSGLIGQYAEPGTLLLLKGELAAGKTTFTQGIGKGLGITRAVKSPTYTIMKDYQKGRLPLYHMDVYRLEETGGTEAGIEEYIESDGITVIEWYEFISELLPADFMKIHLERTFVGEDERKIYFEAVGPKHERLLAKLKAEWKA